MLTPSLTGWRAQYERMQRSYARVNGPYVSSVAYDDDLHHFIQDCWHLKDWIKNDPIAGIGKSIEKQVLTYKSLRIVADLANGSKHLDRDTHREGAYVTSTNVTVHLAQPRPVEIEYIVSLADGSSVLVKNIAHDAITDWNSLLRKLKLI